MTYWAWQELNPRTGEWGLIGAVVLGVSGPLISRKETICSGGFSDIAKGHNERSGHRVRMVRLELGMTLMEYDEKGERIR